MSTVFQDVVAWLHAQQDWLQGAAEVTANGGLVADEDIDRVVERLKSCEGQVVTTTRSFAGLDATATIEAALHLQSLGDVQGIENLAPSRPLEFGSGKLVVVYGPNGSGKSGYTRILKGICGKRSEDALRSNVFQPAPSDRGCTVSYVVGTNGKTASWHPGDEGLPELHAVDVFDAATAEAYLQDESVPSYAPPILRFFANLARCCHRVRGCLETERASLVTALPALPQPFQYTAIASTYQGLRADTSDEAQSRLVQWSKEDQRTLDKLSDRLKVKDPAASARETRAKMAQAIGLASELERAGAAFAQNALSALRVARSGAKQKRKVAEGVAEACAESTELDGIGTETWKAMWEAARTYSRIPYPDQTFPVTTGEARCVICHQTLSDEAGRPNEAGRRLADFEVYVQGKAETDATSAERTYTALLEALPATPSDEDFQFRCEVVGVDFAPVQSVVLAFWSKVRSGVVQLKSGEPDDEVTPLSPPKELLDALKAKSQTLEEQAVQYEQDAKTTDSTALRHQKCEFEARKWAFEQRTAIEAEIGRLKRVRGLEGLMRLANSQPISIQAGKIAERVMTEAYVARFNAELKALGAERIRVELVKTRTDHGKEMHRLTLRGAVSSHASPEVVLSDGERRIVALAAFLADVAEKPYVAPFIFDDPISSLDSEYEWQVALRLANLAKERQVLVFTHRLSLYGAIQEAAAKQGQKWLDGNLEMCYIESFNGSSGHPADQEVWNANTKNANSLLLRRLDDAEKAAETGGGKAYRLHAKGICTDFRKLLERTIEEDLLNKVVKRHRRSVTTDNRIGKLAHIEAADCEFFDKLMTKYSCFEHSQSHETPVVIPERAELRADLESLRNWRAAFKKRGDA